MNPACKALCLLLLMPLLWLAELAAGAPLLDEDAYERRVMSQATSFTLGPGQADQARERAREFIVRFAGAPLRTDSQGLLETARPRGGGVAYGYSVRRTREGSRVRFSVACVPSKAVMVKRAHINARILAHYMISGELIPEYVDI